PGGGGAGGGAGGAVGMATAGPPRGPEPRNLAIGVGPFRSSGSDQATAWIGPALRDGLNSQLTELPGVRVFSDEFMDFVMTREGLSAIAVAQRLGIEKMVSGSVVTVGDTVRVEARVVDVATGVLDGAHVESGRARASVAVERARVRGGVPWLPSALSAEERGRIAARRAPDRDQLGRPLDAEGESRPAPPPQAPPAGPGDGHSRLLDLLGPREAQADEVLPEIEAFLERYRRATEARDVAALGAMYVAFSPEQRAALERYFGGVRDLRVAIDHVEAAVVGDEDAVTYARTDEFGDVQTGRTEHVTCRHTQRLHPVDGRWLFAASR